MNEAIVTEKKRRRLLSRLPFLGHIESSARTTWLTFSLVITSKAGRVAPVLGSSLTDPAMDPSHLELLLLPPMEMLGVPSALMVFSIFNPNLH